MTNAASRPRNPAYRYYVRAGKAFELPWVVVDNWRHVVVDQFHTREEARAYVKDSNHVAT